MNWWNVWIVEWCQWDYFALHYITCIAMYYIALLLSASVPWPTQLTKLPPWGSLPWWSPGNSVHMKASSVGRRIAKSHPFSELCSRRQGLGVYTLTGFQPHFATWATYFCAGHNLRRYVQQSCWKNSFVLRILFGFYLLHKYLWSAYFVSVEVCEYTDG